MANAARLARGSGRADGVGIRGGFDQSGADCGDSRASGRAAESILVFLQVFFVCTATLIPRQPMTALGAEVLAVALLSWVLQGIAQIRYLKTRSGHPLLWLAMRIVQTQLASVPFVVAAVFLLYGWRGGLYWLVPGFVFSFVAGVANAWVLLVEIVR
jgi:hypothetical protein